MRYVRLKIPPGVFTHPTDYANAPHWTDADKVRFHQGWPHTIGGWEQNSTDTFSGICRNLHVWQEIDGTKNLAVGTHTYLYVNQGGTHYDITPLRTTDAALGNNPLATTDGSAVVTVTHTSHGAITGDRAIFSGASTFNNVTIDGEYTLTKVDDNSYTVTAATTANATGSGGGAAVLVDYTINVGRQNSTTGLGWGAGPWGDSTWGTPRATTSILFDARTWSLDNWGEDLVAAPYEGGVYQWDSSVGTGTRAAILSNAPTQVGLIMVTGEDRHLAAFGAHDGSAYDPLLVAWSDQDDNNTWTPASSNTAGSLRLPSGSRIIAVKRALSRVLIWTDTVMYAMQFIGPPDTFGFSELAGSVPPVSPNAVAVATDAVYWMSDGQFLIYDGAVRVIPCPIIDLIFDNINKTQFRKCFAVPNRAYSEIWFFYQTNAGSEINRYAIYNTLDGSWSPGALARTAWVDSGIFTDPKAAGSDSYIYIQESGSDADGSTMSPYIETGPMELGGDGSDLGPGDLFVFVDRLIPDMQGDGEIDVTLYSKNAPGAASEVTKGPYTITDTTEAVDLRLAGRQFRMRFASDDLNSWHLGTFRFRVRPWSRK